MPSKLATSDSPKKARTPAYRLSRGVPLPLGAWSRRGGVNFSIFSKHATACTLVLCGSSGDKPAVEFKLDPRSNRTGEVWHAFVEGADAGTEYGYRFDMQPNPNPQVYRYNPARVLLDPYQACSRPAGLGESSCRASGPTATRWWWKTTSIGATISR